MADATRDLVIQDTATKDDVEAAEQRPRAEIVGVRHEIASVEQRLKAEIQQLRTEMDTLGLRLSVRFGIMLGAGLTLVVAVIGLMLRAR